MRRSILALVCVSALLTLAPVVGAQEGPELEVLCVGLTGQPVDGGWDEFSLQDAIASGTAEVTSVAPGADCATAHESDRCLTVAGSAPEAGWTQGTLVDFVTAGRAQIVLLASPDECAQVIRETVDPADAPERLPVTVLETGVVVSDFGSSFVAIVTNPNADTWGAQGLPLAVRVFDEGGEEVETTSAFTTLLPAQTGAVVGLLTTTARPDRIEVVPEGADFTWLPTELASDTLRASSVELKKDPALGFKTSGKLHNDGDAQLEGVLVVAVHRDKTGGIVGADLALLEPIPAGGTVTFEIASVSGIGIKQVAQTDIFWQLSMVP